ncbi:hypothetical protein Ahy_A02g008755 isoform A [Arachis hypogaea]|uniref:Uncharacterized protein n=1 Tax=Arachis hypogaea TaxID=3818 RepID=A0A445EFP6_ARAHY|nr:hypothetical protein Ahy_A02g008755 isoform A [Arachis hypogaea]
MPKMTNKIKQYNNNRNPFVLYSWSFLEFLFFLNGFDFASSGANVGCEVSELGASEAALKYKIN